MPRFPYVLALLLLAAGFTYLFLRQKPRPAAREPAAPVVSPPGPAKQPPPPKEFTAQVVAVTDGDTLRVRYGDRELTLRLHGIDAPESRRRQPYSAQAKQALSSAVLGHDVRVENRGRDRNLRIIAVVYRGTDNVNARLVSEGLAWSFTKYSREFDSQQREARRLGKGLWRDPNPVPPWEWRSRKSPAAQDAKLEASWQAARSALCFASAPGGSRTARRSGAWSTGARPVFRSPWSRSSAIWTAAAPVRAA